VTQPARTACPRGASQPTTGVTASPYCTSAVLRRPTIRRPARPIRVLRGISRGRLSALPKTKIGASVGLFLFARVKRIAGSEQPESWCDGPGHAWSRTGTAGKMVMRELASLPRETHRAPLHDTLPSYFAFAFFVSVKRNVFGHDCRLSSLKVGLD
jgi:hypothetical protein